MALVRVLGVYPPGSLVLLSNESIGMVININLKNRLRPLVLLFNEERPSDQPDILDLEEDEEITICQNLRPRDVSRKAAKYLNPRNMVNYLAGDTANIFASASQ